jgi:hypothetical protein
MGTAVVARVVPHSPLGASNKICRTRTPRSWCGLRGRAAVRSGLPRVLWQRTALGWQGGRPEFGRVHPLRQRRAMLRLLFQVCGGPADQMDNGVL